MYINSRLGNVNCNTQFKQLFCCFLEIFEVAESCECVVFLMCDFLYLLVIWSQDSVLYRSFYYLCIIH